MIRRTVLLTLILAGVEAGAAAAQAWESPSFLAPRPGEDLGIYLVKLENSDDVGVAAIWRQEGNLNLGVRAGIFGGDHYQVGAELYGPLAVGAQSGLLVAWTLGAGATFNDVTWLRVPVGVTIGVNLGAAGGLQLKPYAHPRVALDLLAYDNIAGDEVTETEFAVDLDLGADMALGQSFVLRVGFTLSRLTDRDRGRNAFGAGLAYRTPRRISVR